MGLDVLFSGEGLELSMVISDSNHYSPFLCGLCKCLVSLDAVVTSRCSHPFCRTCLQDWVLSENQEERQTCPCCRDSISPDKSARNMELGSETIGAQPLQQAQPLAYEVLKLVQVKCLKRDSGQKDGCETEQSWWKGDYGDLRHHAVERCEETNLLIVTDTKNSANENGNSYLLPRARVSSDDPKRDERPETPQRVGSNLEELAQARKSLLKQGSSSRVLDDNSPTERLAKLSPRLARWKSNSSMQVSPARVQTSPNARQINGGRDAPPNKIARKISVYSQAGSSKAESSSLEETIDDDFGSTTCSNFPSSPFQQSQQSSSQSTLDWQASINSVPLWDDSDLESNAMTAVDEEELSDDDDDETMVALHLDPEDEETITSPEVKSKQILERAEKLKKQANAKFNKGDFAAARLLYTEGITVMGAFAPLSDHERKLLSNMHSNRAVTYFRDKDFVSCTKDCDKAISYDRTFDKSWVRKWRALVAIGEFEEAHLFIQEAAQLLPDSTRIQDEFKRSCQEHDVMESAHQLIEDDRLEEAREVLHSIAKESTNLRLICMAALLDTSLGFAESSLELSLQALRLNPSYPEALELKGTSLFLMGDTQQGAHVLYEAYCMDGDCPSIKASLTKCQKTHQAASQARSAIKRGMYDEAARTFSLALSECEPIAPQSPLYTMLLAERAEASLLSTKYLEALKDCQEIFDVNIEHPGAWVIRSEVLIALGKVEDAKMELSEIRKGWGADDPLIEEGYRRVDFELRVEAADEDLLRFVSELESGNCRRLSTTLALQRRRRTNESRDSRSYGSERRPSNEGQEVETVDERFHSRRRSNGSREHERQSHASYDQGGDEFDRKAETETVEISQRQKNHEERSVLSHTKGTRRKQSERKSDEKSTMSSVHKIESKVRSSIQTSDEGDRGSRTLTKDYARERKSHPNGRSGKDRRGSGIVGRSSDDNLSPGHRL